VEGLEEKHEELGLLLEMAQEEDDEATLQEVSRELRKLEREIKKAELQRLLSGEHDASNAIVTIHSGAGGTEAQDWADMLLRMYLRWCERQGFQVRMLDLMPGEEAGIKGGGNGDLYIFVSIEAHSIFQRSEENLFYEFPISLADATLGTTVEVPTIDGEKAKVKIPAGTQNGKQFRLRGKGMPIIRDKDYGDLYIRAVTEVPVSLNKEQKILLEQFKKLEDTKTNPSIKNFFEKAKRFWKS